MNPKPIAPSAHDAHAQSEQAHGPALPLLLKGPTFANILGTMPVVTPKAPAPAQLNAQGCKMQTSLASLGASLGAQAVLPVHPDADKRRRPNADDLDPSARQAAQLAPPMTMGIFENEKQVAAAQTNARVSLEDLVPALVKKIAWSGDAQRGTVRMELGAGELAGSTLTVSAENGRVSVDVAAPGTDLAAWRERLSTRLTARGLSLDSIEVH
jgi:hypothetical protein